jgi:hypothetical protein
VAAPAARPPAAVASAHSRQTGPSTPLPFQLHQTSPLSDRPVNCSPSLP